MFTGQWEKTYATTTLSNQPLTCLFETGGVLWASSGQHLYSAVDTRTHVSLWGLVRFGCGVGVMVAVVVAVVVVVIVVVVVL